MNAEQWLTDLEAKTKTVLLDVNNLEAALEFVDTADPIAVMRMIAMVKILSKCLAGRGHFIGDIKSADIGANWIEYAYRQTEPTPQAKGRTGPIKRGWTPYSA